MKKTTILLVLLFFICAILLADMEDDSLFVKGELLFRTDEMFDTIYIDQGIAKTETPWFNSLSDQYQISEINPVYTDDVNPDFTNLYLAKFPTETPVEDVYDDFVGKTNVQYAQPNFLYKTCCTNDTYYPNQSWFYERISADNPVVWQDIFDTENPIPPNPPYSPVIVLFDTGIFIGTNEEFHEDIYPDNYIAGYDFVHDDPTPYDDSGHGTFNAGLICAKTDNNMGIASMAGGTEDPDEWNGTYIIVVKTAQYNGWYTTLWLIQAMEWVEQYVNDPNLGSFIFYFSFAHKGYQQADSLYFDNELHSWIQYYNDIDDPNNPENVFMVGAAGNFNTEMGDKNYPAGWDEVLAVAATDYHNEKAYYSSKGEWIDISAPCGQYDENYNGCLESENVFSTTPMDDSTPWQLDEILDNEYDYYSDHTYGCRPEGTSKAAALVTALAGVLRAKDNELTAYDLKGIITGTATELPPISIWENFSYLELYNQMGAGIINVEHALNEYENPHPNLVLWDRVVIFDDITPSTYGNNNQLVNAGETVRLTLTLKDFWIDATGIIADISINDETIEFTPESINFGNIDAYNTGSAEVLMSVPATVEPDLYEITLNITSNNGSHNEQVKFNIEIYPYISHSSQFSSRIFCPPKSAHLDNIPEPEVVFSLYDMPEICIFKNNSEFENIEITRNCRISDVATADLNGDGYDEIIFSISERFGSYKSDLAYYDYINDSYTYGYIGAYREVRSAPVIADLDNDGNKEIIVWAFETNSSGNPQYGYCYLSIFDTEGNRIGTELSIEGWNYYGPSVADIDEDYINELVFCTGSVRTGYTSYVFTDYSVYSYQLNEYGILEIEWQTDIPIPGGFFVGNFALSPASIANLDNNAEMEIIVKALKFMLEDPEMSDIYYYILSGDNGNILNEESKESNGSVLDNYEIPVGNLRENSPGLEILRQWCYSLSEYNYSADEVTTEFEFHDGYGRPYSITMCDFVGGSEVDLKMLNTGTGGIATLENTETEYIPHDFEPYNIGPHCYTPSLALDIDLDGNINFVNIRSQYVENGVSFFEVYNYSNSADPTTMAWPEFKHDSHNTSCYAQTYSGEVPPGDTLLWSNRVCILDDVNVPMSSTLIIEPGTIIEVAEGKEILIEGMCIANGSEGNSIMFCCMNDGALWKGITISSSIETNDEIQLKNVIINDAEIAVAADGSHRISLDTCDISCNEAGLYFYKTCPEINNCYISSNINYGIYFSNVSKADVTGNTIINNGNSGHDGAGIICYNSSPFIHSANLINENTSFGIVTHNNSHPRLGSEHSADGNLIHNNSGDEIRVVNWSIPYIANGLNDIYDDSGDYSIYHEVLVSLPYDGCYNYWGTIVEDEIYDRIFPPGSIDFVPFCTEPNFGIDKEIDNSDPPKELLQTAKEHEENTEFNSAIATYHELISLYPEADEVALAIKGIFFCTKEMVGNFVSLESYYLDIADTIQTEWLSNCAEKQAIRCKVEYEDYDGSITDYENILLNNPSLEDSVYCVIDIGNAYLDAWQGKGDAKGKFPKLKPKNSAEHYNKSLSLLSILTKSQPPAEPPIQFHNYLSQNFPNPFNHSTKINYSIASETKVDISIYNIKGQLVRRLVDEKQFPNNYSISWDGKDNNGKPVSNGIYFYKIEAGTFSKTQKCLMLR